MFRLICFVLAMVFTGGFVLAQDAATLYKEGLKLKDEKKSAAALEKFKQATALNPSYTEAFYEMGWCQNDLKDYVNAYLSLKKVRQAWPTIPKVHFEMGYAFQNIGNADSALACYNRCLQLKPGYAGIHKQMGYIHYNRDSYAAALEQFEIHIAEAKEEIKDYLFWYRKGFAENAEKKFTLAKESLQKSLLYKKDYLNTYLELGFACTKLKLDEEAITWFNKAIETDAKSYIACNGIAEVYRDNKKNMAEAMNWYQKTLELNRLERKANYGMGYCLNAGKQFTEAIPYLKQAIKSEPTYTAAYIELGYSYYKTSNYGEALTNLKKAIDLNPKNENARYYGCLVYVAQKDKPMAQKMVDELKVLSSKHAASLQEKVDKM
jgi:protein O-GlcNAc transferase